MATLEVRLKRASKVYREGELIRGVVAVTSKGDISHNGLSLTLEGTVNLQLSAKSVGVFEAFYNSLKPIPLLNYTLDLVKPGKFPNGTTEVPFELPLKAKTGKTLYETYHGVFVSVMYNMRCDMKRSLLSRDIQKVVEFIVETKSDITAEDDPKRVEFTVSPESLQNVKNRVGVPDFLVTGYLDTANCIITKPFTGELTVSHSSASIRSVELQLVRVETCGCAEGFSRDATEIQNIQIGEGDVCRKVALPIYMIFPRLFTCPTLNTSNFKIEFEVNIIIVFQDDHLVTENFPIKLLRT